MFRIISGRARGLKLPVPDLPGVRPTTDRVRENAFNALQSRLHLDGLRVLDLFAGAGTLGLEALSRGAAQVDFVERQEAVARQLTANATRIGGGHAVHRRAVAEHLAGRPPAAPYDLVFLDPPYADGLVGATLQALMAPGWLAPGAWLCVEHPAQQAVVAPPGLGVDFARVYGQTGLTLLTSTREPSPR